MELKLELCDMAVIIYFLLIVPYGIETESTIPFLFWSGLLIVPYGIETESTIPFLFWSGLLIVPYGIETGLIIYTHICENSF